MPKEEIGALRFLHEHPTYDGRGVVIAILDSGIDPRAQGLQLTTDGKPKILDVLDCTGSGDCDTSKVVKADKDGFIVGASGRRLGLNPSWANPSCEWRIGYKRAFDLMTSELQARLSRHRKRAWAAKHRVATAAALAALAAFDTAHPRPAGGGAGSLAECARAERAELVARVTALADWATGYRDDGPGIDAVVWHDGAVWRAALDTTAVHLPPTDDDVIVGAHSATSGALADFIPLTNYVAERQFAVLSPLDGCTVVLNIYADGNVLSIVTDASPHGTHVAGIAAAHHPELTALNGVAPGAQLVSLKIGDHRLGSMETGVGLARAAIAVLRHRCDIINMSYGEPSGAPDTGRFVALARELVDRHGVVFVSSAGNDGPALSTVGAPGGTSSAIIGVGAHVSPALAAAAHSTREPPPPAGLQYSWSSRGPTADGARGVCLSAPGGAIAPVPAWTQEKRSLMNGTSMSSPNAAGGVALLLSAERALGRWGSSGVERRPHTIRRALENTCLALIDDGPSGPLAAGCGLLQVDRAHAYMCADAEWATLAATSAVATSTALAASPTSPGRGRASPASYGGTGGVTIGGGLGPAAITSAALPLHDVGFAVRVERSDSGWSGRGVYLRNAAESSRPWEGRVTVMPSFHQAADASASLGLELKLELIPSTAWVHCPGALLLTGRGRGFSLRVDPAGLAPGVHVAEITAIDVARPALGPMFRLPVVVIKPQAPVDGGDCAFGMSLPAMKPGKMERRFVAVPAGSTWCEVFVKATAAADGPRSYYLHCVQLLPQLPHRSAEYKRLMTLSPNGVTTAAFAVVGAATLEICIAQFWSSAGCGGLELTAAFHSIVAVPASLTLEGARGPARLTACAALRAEKLVVAAKLTTLCVAVRPTEVVLRPYVDVGRDAMPDGRCANSLVLTYAFTVAEAAKVSPRLPALTGRMYDAPVDGQMCLVFDANKALVGVGDVYAGTHALKKGDYTARVMLRHDEVAVLDKLKHLPLVLETTLESAIKLTAFGDLNAAIAGAPAWRDGPLASGESRSIWLCPPADSALPKGAAPGTVLKGICTLGALATGDGGACPAEVPLTYIVPPTAAKLDAPPGPEDTDGAAMSAADKLAAAVRDLELKHLREACKPKDADTAAAAHYDALWAKLAAGWPNYLPLLLEAMTRAVCSKADAASRIAAADAVIATVNVSALALLSLQAKGCEPDSAAAAKAKKAVDEPRAALGEALYTKVIALADVADAHAASGDAPAAAATLESLEAAYAQLRTWADVGEPGRAMATVRRETTAGRPALALAALRLILEDKERLVTSRDVHDRRVALLRALGWDAWASDIEASLLTKFPPSFALF